MIDCLEVLGNEIKHIISSKEPISSMAIARKVNNFFKHLINEIEYDNELLLYEAVRDWADEFTCKSLPYSYIASSVALHIKKICLDEFCDITGGSKELSECSPFRSIFNKSRRNRKVVDDQGSSSILQDTVNETKTSFQDSLAEALEEFENELESTVECIANQAPEHIHSSEIILTYGYSSTIAAFLKSASRKRHYTLIIAEGGCDNKGHILAKELVDCENIQITIIPDSSIFAIMSRINKVIIGAYAIDVSGCVFGPAGINALALAAKFHLVPILVCCGLFKLIPGLSRFIPSANLNADERLPASPNFVFDHAYSGVLPKNITISNPTFEEISSELITLFITNVGAQSPHNIYRLAMDIFEGGFNLQAKKSE